MIRRYKGAVLAAVLAMTIAPSALAQDFPAFTNYVVDDAGVIPDDAERQMDAELKDFQDRTTNQVAVAVVDTTGDASLEDYANDLFEEWGVGQEEKDNGVLLLIAMDDRKLRIETGFGVEGDLTDLESGRIVRDIIVPRMQQGDVGDAVLAGTHAIRAALGDTEVDAPVPIAPDEPEGDRIPFGGLLYLIPLLVFGPLSAFGRRGARRRGWVTPILWGGGFGGGGSNSGGWGGGGFGGGGGGGSGGGGASGGW